MSTTRPTPVRPGGAPPPSAPIKPVTLPKPAKPAKATP